MKKISRIQRQEVADKVILGLLNEGWDITQIRALLLRGRKTACDIISSKRELPITKIKKIMKEKAKAGTLIGMENKLKEIRVLLKYGTKGVFIGGYHGLGKSTLVSQLAKEFDANLFRIQITEMTSEFDIIGSPDPQTGKFINSEFVDKIIEATKNKKQKYFFLLDEFTRGREQATNVLYPVLAERTLFINSPYSEIKNIDLTDNIVIFATGNLHDTGQRKIGQAESDRYNTVIVDFVKDENVLGKIIKMNSTIPKELSNALIKLYLNSIDEYEQGRILAMSIRTMIESAKIIEGLNNDVSHSPVKAFKTAIKLTFYGTSQAVTNPNYRATYNELLSSVTRKLRSKVTVTRTRKRKRV